MPLPNRVDPWGRCHATATRGLFFGNRGVLHDEDGRIVRHRSSERRWIICLTEFKGRRRRLLRPNHYTELFFLDEAVALAAGHRPCAECRRDAFRSYLDALDDPSVRRAPQLDARLDAERGRPRDLDGPVSALPVGAFVDDGDRALLVLEDRLVPWSPAGYGAPVAADPRAGYRVLTPATSLRVLSAGYPVTIHPDDGELDRSEAAVDVLPGLHRPPAAGHHRALHRQSFDADAARALRRLFEHGDVAAGEDVLAETGHTGHRPEVLVDAGGGRPVRRQTGGHGLVAGIGQVDLDGDVVAVATAGRRVGRWGRRARRPDAGAGAGTDETTAGDGTAARNSGRRPAAASNTTLTVRVRAAPPAPSRVTATEAVLAGTVRPSAPARAPGMRPSTASTSVIVPASRSRSSVSVTVPSADSEGPRPGPALTSRCVPADASTSTDRAVRAASRMPSPSRRRASHDAPGQDRAERVDDQHLEPLEATVRPELPRPPPGIRRSASRSASTPAPTTAIVRWSKPMVRPSAS